MRNIRVKNQSFYHDMHLTAKTYNKIICKHYIN